MTSTGIAQDTIALLGTYAIHSTILFAAAWAASKVLTSPRIRDILWKGALVGGLVTTGLGASLGGGPLAIHLDQWSNSNNLTPGMASTETSRGEVIGFQGPGGTESIAGAIQHAPGSTSSRTALQVREEGQQAAPSAPLGLTLLLALWLAAGSFNLVRLWRERNRVQRLLAHSQPVTSGRMFELMQSVVPSPPASVSLATCPNLKSPLAWGRSRVVVPDYFAEELDDASLVAMLAHECEHLRRRDGAWLLFARSLQGIFAFQPLLGRAIRELSEQAELLCDEAAMRKSGGGVALAKCLATIADRLTQPQTPYLPWLPILHNSWAASSEPCPELPRPWAGPVRPYWSAWVQGRWSPLPAPVPS